MGQTAAALTVSVIIPAYNRAEELRECLTALKNQTVPPVEVIVVDDHSSDGTPEAAREYGVTLLRAPENQSANYCRNLGAQFARGDILMFLDSDTVPSSNSVETASLHFSDETTDAVVGLYSATHRHQNVSSQYKNLWIRYSYVDSAGHIDWIFGAVSAIRAKCFHRIGGFDHTMMMTHGGEDLELGKRMTRSNLRILLDPRYEVEHLRHYTLTDLLKNDLRRTDGFVRIALQVGHLTQSLHKGFVNVYPSFLYAVVLSWFMVLSAVTSVFIPSTVWIFVLSLLLYGTLNSPFLLYFYRHRGGWQTIQASVIIVLDQLTCGVGGVMGLVKVILRRTMTQIQDRKQASGEEEG